ncbi:SMI1/KNR4 family protein [Streptomyces sp. NPDC059352]|uniref:SMI1/KNR4 family protein n=1 Tax=Streptomyces sp. NPDC059352 TaxID=3346810 RepID=UPI0036BFBDA6
MDASDELVRLIGPPAARNASPDDWTDVEDYLGTALPGDFKAFLDSYGAGVISGELVLFHPRGTSPLLARMHRIHEAFGRSRQNYPAEYSFPFHPAPGGLISWGYDYSGDEHFFQPCGPDPDRWKVVTEAHGSGSVVFDGSFTEFVLSFVRRLYEVDRYHGLDPDDLEFLEPGELEELVESGEIGPIKPSFTSY